VFDAAGNHVPSTYSAPNFLQGKDGVAIGGGARADATGTIIILPSADVSELYGGIYYQNTSTSCWDIGNCSTLFYLNKADPWVCTDAAANRQKAQSFTARLEDNKTGENIYAKIAATSAFPEIASFAALVGTTPSTTTPAGVIGSVIGGAAADKLYYYTNSSVDFFTDATPNAPNDNLSLRNRNTYKR